jgi:hypothetical protein
VWATKTGELERAENPIEMKKNTRAQKSLLRIGCEIIQAVLFEIERHSKVNIFKILKMLTKQGLLRLVPCRNPIIFDKVSDKQ